MLSTSDRRLRELRAFDTIGLYAKDGPTTGHAHDDLMAITIDATNRVDSVMIGDLDKESRSTPAVQTLLDEAYADAITTKLAASGIETSARRTGHRPMPVGGVVEMRPQPTAADLACDPYPGQRISAGPGARLIGAKVHATGASDNECVEVLLSAAASSGTLTIDGGWLHRVSPTNLANAITQAFAAAYRDRDRG